MERQKTNMSKWGHVSQRGAPPHLPPPERCAVTAYDNDGTIVVTEKRETPLDSFGRPDHVAMLGIIASTLDADYQWSPATNIHQLAFASGEMRPDCEGELLATQKGVVLTAILARI